MDSSDHVRSYYDSNTQRFANWGPGKTSRSIHREVWGEGVTTAREATWHIDTLIGDVVEAELNKNPSLRILDLGCGLAGTLSSLAFRFPDVADLTGVTISPVQVRMSREAIAKEGLASRIHVVEADFHELPPMQPADVTYAIEAFVHARDADGFFNQVRKVSSEHATLILVDDFLTEDEVADAHSSRYARLIKDFSAGWRAPNVMTVQKAAEIAGRYGFILESEVDLTNQLRIGRKRDRFIDVLYRLAGRMLIKQSYLGGLMGGAALQRAIARGWIKYSMLVFRKNLGGE